MNSRAPAFKVLSADTVSESLAATDAEQSRRPAGRRSLGGDQFPRPRAVPVDYAVKLGGHDTSRKGFVLAYADEALSSDETVTGATRKGSIVLGFVHRPANAPSSEKPLFPDIKQLPPELGNGICKPFQPDIDPGLGTTGLLRSYMPGITISIQANLDCDGLIAVLHTLID